jgi:hypothetical protein
MRVNMRSGVRSGSVIYASAMVLAQLGRELMWKDVQKGRKYKPGYQKSLLKGTRRKGIAR